MLSVRDNDADKQIAGLTRGYQNARQTFLAIYSRAIHYTATLANRRQVTTNSVQAKALLDLLQADPALAAKLNALGSQGVVQVATMPNHEQAITDNKQHTIILRNLLQNYSNLAITLETQLDAQGIIHSEFLLTKLKLKALVARFNLSSGFTEEAISIFRGVIIQLMDLIKDRRFKFTEDFAFQQEVYAAFRSVAYHHSARKTKQDSRQSAEINTCGYEFAKKCPDNIIKLTLFFDYWSTADVKGICYMLIREEYCKMESY